MEKIDNCPLQYGLEFHGWLHRFHCQELLKLDGNFLVRRNKSVDKNYTLSLRFSGLIKHYHLYYNGQHFVGERKFDKLTDLVADGLVTLYLESKAGKFLQQLPMVNYRQSPYFTLTRSARLKNSKFAKSRLLNLNQADHSLLLNQNSSKQDNLTNNSFQKKSNLHFHNESKYSENSSQTCKFEDDNSKKLYEANKLSNSFSSLENSCDSLKIRNSNSNDSLKNGNSSLDSLEKLDLEEISTEKPHLFQNLTFTGLHWCGLCGNFLWGFKLQGVKCFECGMKAHRPCSLKVPNDCCPQLKKIQGIFGMDLETSLKFGSSKENLCNEPILIPPIVTACIAQIEERGIEIEGIYRVPGSHEQIDSLRIALEKDNNHIILDEITVPDINVVAGLLKMYFRLLPLRLITAPCFNALLKALKTENEKEKITLIQNALRILPQSHLNTLIAIVSHLAKVCEKNMLNKMSADSLSTIFGPTLIQSDADIRNMKPEDLLALKINAQEPKVIEMLILLHKKVFALN